MADVKVPLPPGCDGLEVGGKTYRREMGGHARVPEERADLIRQADTGGIITVAAPGMSVGTKRGRWCMECTPPRLWNVWSERCPRCGAETVPD